jgi:hypothetical protein
MWMCIAARADSRPGRSMTAVRVPVGPAANPLATSNQRRPQLRRRDAVGGAFLLAGAGAALLARSSARSSHELDQAIEQSSAVAGG